MNLIKPKPLKDGSGVMFIAPAGAISDRACIDRAKKFFEERGYRVYYSEHLFNKNNYLSDTDENRLSDLHNAFERKDIDCIICARGGYGSLRLIEKIDYGIVRNNPKIFCGYSDITVLSAMFLKRAGLVTYSGPMAKGDFGAEEISEYTTNSFFETVKGNKRQEYLSKDSYNNGECQGIIYGGNLSSIVSMCGIDFIPDDDFILFVEDLNEPVYKIDKMMTQLLNIADFKRKLKGLILGDFLDNGYPEQLRELFTVIGSKHSIPVLSGFKITHDRDKITIPIGAKSSIEDSRLIINSL